ncbi:MAG: site-2 protease family protein [Acidobacteriota bacterium]
MEHTLAVGLVWYVAFLFSTTLHEAAHAWAALRMGDPTAYHGGQVTLNPLPHVRREPFGMVVVPILLFALSGWMLGWASAPYDPAWADRHPKRSGLMALAGPAANLVLALGAGVAIRLGVEAGWFVATPGRTLDALVRAAPDAFGGPAGPGPTAAATFLSVFFLLNLILLVFNLLPLPPMDGSGALPLVMSDELAIRYRNALRHPAIGLAGLLIAWRIFWPIFQPILVFAVRLIYPGG